MSRSKENPKIFSYSFKHRGSQQQMNFQYPFAFVLCCYGSYVLLLLQYKYPCLSFLLILLLRWYTERDIEQLIYCKCVCAWMISFSDENVGMV